MIQNGKLNLSGSIQLRGGTAANLTTVNPVPKAREIMVETDTGKIKIGDGVSAWNNLSHTGGSGSSSGESSAKELYEFKNNNLGSEITEEQKEVIRAGTFNGLHIGDYWEKTITYSAGGNAEHKIKMRIVDFDYYLGKGTNAHHVVIMPDGVLKGRNCYMTGGDGYAVTYYRTSYKTKAVEVFVNFFGSGHILTYSDNLENSLSSYILATDCTVELPDIRQLSGTLSNDGSTQEVQEASYSKTIFKLFDEYPEFLIPDNLEDVCRGYWYRNCPSSGNYGLADSSTGIMDFRNHPVNNSSWDCSARLFACIR